MISIKPAYRDRFYIWKFTTGIIAQGGYIFKVKIYPEELSKIGIVKYATDQFLMINYKPDNNGLRVLLPKPLYFSKASFNSIHNCYTLKDYINNTTLYPHIETLMYKDILALKHSKDPILLNVFNFLSNMFDGISLKSILNGITNEIN